MLTVTGSRSQSRDSKQGEFKASSLSSSGFELWLHIRIIWREFKSNWCKLMVSSPTWKELRQYHSNLNTKKNLNKPKVNDFLEVTGQTTTPKPGETGQSSELQLRSTYLKQKHLEPINWQECCSDLNVSHQVFVLKTHYSMPQC